MNASLLERLRGFQIPPTTPISPENYVVARLRGVDFEGIINSPDFGFERPFDAEFGKIMVRTTSHLLGGDACGCFGFIEQDEMSVLLDHRCVADHWQDAVDLQSYLVGQASSKMSLQLEEEALFSCKLYAFAKSDLVIAFFMWRRQEAVLGALDIYCKYVLSKDEATSGSVHHILEGLGANDKEEILRQHNIEYSELPAWQRQGAGVSLSEDLKIIVETNLPLENAFGPYLQQYL